MEQTQSKQISHSAGFRSRPVLPPHSASGQACRDGSAQLVDGLRNLSNQIFHYVNSGLPRADFLREFSHMLIDFFRCDIIELRLIDTQQSRCELLQQTDQSFSFKLVSCTQIDDAEIINSSSTHTGEQSNSGLKILYRDILRGNWTTSSPFFTKNGSFWTGDTQRPAMCGDTSSYDLSDEKDYRSVVIMPIPVGNEIIGFMQLKSKAPYFFTEYEIILYEDFVRTLGAALVSQQVQSALRERIKELTCLYGLARLVEQPATSLKETLQSIVNLLPTAWLYPDIACSRIVLDGHIHSTPDFQDGPHKQVAQIVIDDEPRGTVEVVYVEDRPTLDEGPFLKEERNLLDTVARELALIIEQKYTEEAKTHLQEQLRHADRLATIGQLAAGVAHELNEPLGNILGFAQLAKKNTELPTPVAQDIEKIEKAGLHAREIVKKLMLFARQTPPRKTQVNLNQVIEEGLYFLESRCVKEGIKLVRSLTPGLPEISADPSQLQQVLVNLVVNAIQSMPQGGILTVKTLAPESDYVSLIVEDTGTGMSADVMKQIFIPFWTTKDVGQGTGLGLSVVHGIVTSHGGSIKVNSEVGKGSIFEIKLPLSEKGND